MLTRRLFIGTTAGAAGLFGWLGRVRFRPQRRLSRGPRRVEWGYFTFVIVDGLLISCEFKGVPLNGNGPDVRDVQLFENVQTAGDGAMVWVTCRLRRDGHIGIIGVSVQSRGSEEVVMAGEFWNPLDLPPASDHVRVVVDVLPTMSLYA